MTTTTYTIPQKMSGTGSIHDIASDLFDRDIVFAAGCKYAVVLAAFHGGGGYYTTHRTETGAIAASRRNSKYSIIDTDGREYAANGDRLVRL